jgi:lactate dehydrogenase-like 2-hydroxyacid dehydrogenase
MSASAPRLRAVVATDLPDPARQVLAGAFDAQFMTPEDFRRYGAPDGCEVVLVSIQSPLDAAGMARLPASVRAVGTYSVGLDHLDLAAAEARGLAVFNTPGVLAASVADAAMLLILGAARRATESIDLIRGRRWKGWSPLQLNGVELAGKRLGVLGMGGIGLPIAARARAFGMEIAYSNRRPLAEDLAAGATFIADAGALVEAADVLVLAAPSTPETRGFLNAERLARARPSLIVVNVGRGDLVDDDALIAALSEGRIFGAGLDVFAGEPNLDPRYFDLPNVFMLPHIGSSTMEARVRMAEALATGVAAWREGHRPPNQVR